MMKLVIEGNNRSYNFIAPSLLASFIHTHINKNKNNADVARFINLFRIVYLLNCALAANIFEV